MRDSSCCKSKTHWTIIFRVPQESCLFSLSSS